jgi:hypothetical protein
MMSVCYFINANLIVLPGRNVDVAIYAKITEVGITCIMTTATNVMNASTTFLGVTHPTVSGVM